MKKTVLLLFLTVLSACITFGCSDGSKKHIIVQEKNELNTDSYRQTSDTQENADDSDAGNGQLSDSASSDNGSGHLSDSGSSDSIHKNALARRLQIPESHTFFKEFPESHLQLSCRAKIELTDTDHVSVYKVRQKPFDQAWIDRVTHVFFGDLPVYDSNKYRQPTKEWAREKLRRLKAFQAEGNTDPYGHIAAMRESGSRNPEGIYNLEKDIEQWEAIYSSAPETVEKVEVSPGFNVSESAENADGNQYFSGIVEMDGDVFDYYFKKSGPIDMEIRILRDSGEDPDHTWFGYDWYPIDLPAYSVSRNGYVPSLERAEQIAGISPSAAAEMCDRYMEKLGLSDFSAKHIEHSLSYCQPEDMQAERIFIDAGYRVVYTRDIQGFPVTYEISPGGAYAAGTYDLSNAWCFETVEFYVNQNGLQKAMLRNLYEIEELMYDNIELMAFPEIMDIFGQTMPIRFSESSGKYTIDRITLGYARIYDPGMDSTLGLLVPVWDFFGKHVDNYKDGETSILDIPTQSFLTINAADGTVINRNYGY